MLYHVTEKFKVGALLKISERFKSKGRMLPEGLEVKASWMKADGCGCFLTIQTDDPELFKKWEENWNDLIEFSICEVVTSSEYWSKKN